MTEKFHERFDIEVDLEQARERFKNRLFNRILRETLWGYGGFQDHIAEEALTILGVRAVAAKETLAERFDAGWLELLHAAEAVFGACQSKEDWDRALEVHETITWALSSAEVDLGIIWDSGSFRRSGAESLDNVLVNDPLRWLRAEGYETVAEPYEKGLRHFLASESELELLQDALTDMYEALEALAGIVTGRPKSDLSANRELFLSRVKASDPYKKPLREYVDYANLFRHQTPPEGRPTLSRREVESFLYMTGVFVRLAMPVAED